MKTIQKIIQFTFIGILIVALSNSFVLAQGKPKGKEWKVPEADAKKKSEVKSDDATIKAGKDVWSAQCKSCHGAKGLGDGTKAEKIDITCGDFSKTEVQNLSDGSLYWKITEGRKPMPSFAEKLSDTERWQVVAYVRTLKKGGAATTTSTTTTTTTTKTDPTPPKKDTDNSTTGVKNTNSDNLNKTDTTKVTYTQYKQLQSEVDQLKKDMAEMKAKLDAEKNEKDKK
ncbi:MAG: cytochrome c [Bacteroidetes bacterium]|nr:cytochrome c [Bacteroidota bacterium]